jgi:hypothetical protein
LTQALHTLSLAAKEFTMFADRLLAALLFSALVTSMPNFMAMRSAV